MISHYCVLHTDVYLKFINLNLKLQCPTLKTFSFNYFIIAKISLPTRNVWNSDMVHFAHECVCRIINFYQPCIILLRWLTSGLACHVLHYCVTKILLYFKVDYSSYNTVASSIVVYSPLLRSPAKRYLLTLIIAGSLLPWKYHGPLMSCPCDFHAILTCPWSCHLWGSKHLNEPEWRLT